MKLSHYLTVLVAIILLGMVIVWQQVQAVQLGYEVDELLREREKLNEDKRRLEVELLEETQPAALLQHADRLNIPVEGLGLLTPPRGQPATEVGAAHPHSRGAEPEGSILESRR